MHDLARLEYERLGRHIESQFRLITQVFTASLIASLTLFAYIVAAFSGKPDTGWAPNAAHVLALVLPAVVVLGCAFLVSSLRRELFKWAAYISVYRKEIAMGRYAMRPRVSDTAAPSAKVSPWIRLWSPTGRWSLAVAWRHSWSGLTLRGRLRSFCLPSPVDSDVCVEQALRAIPDAAKTYVANWEKLRSTSSTETTSAGSRNVSSPQVKSQNLPTANDTAPEAQTANNTSETQNENSTVVRGLRLRCALHVTQS